MDRKLTVLKIANAGSFAATIIVNGLANGLPLNGRTTGELSDMYPNLFVPAGITFSIWGVIYLLLGAFIIHQFTGGSSTDRTVGKIGWWFAASSLMNMSWIFLWHYLQVALSVAVMLCLLVSLIVIYSRLGIGTSAAGSREYVFFRLPFSVYLGWITVATIANITAFLVDLGWRGEPLGEVFWAVVMVVAAAVFGMVFVFRRKDIPYALVIAWALTGIILKRAAAGGEGGSYIILTAVAGIAAIAVSVFIVEFRKESGDRQTA